mmetsp:Transcript_35765/g.93546  ORF Transcript_35765/g.93546 Transcript_35765/m.93546 type:complete len:667 (+) Transcript_35765:182-2182(+)
MESGGVPGGYTFPAVLHFLHREHNKYERERKWWLAEKAELQARIAFLEGQRLGEANLKRDLIRRIKMLEVALQSERAKNSKEGAAPAPAPEDACLAEPATPEGSVNVDKEGRHVLLQYLSEMQYTDAVIEAQAQRVRGMLDSWSPTDPPTRLLGDSVAAANDLASNAAAEEEDEGDEDEGEGEGEGDGPPFAQLVADDDDDDNVDDFLLGMPTSVVPTLSDESEGGELAMTAVDPEAEQQIPQELPLGAAAPASTEPSEEDLALEQHILKNFKSGKMSKRMGKGLKKARMQATAMFDEPDLEAKLGELSEVDASSIAAEAEGAAVGSRIAASGDGEDTPRKTWKMKMELRGHLDGVREVLFHPHEPLLVSASEDHTVAVWKAAVTPQAKKLMQANEPLRILRGHTAPVYAAAITASGVLFTGGADATLIAWTMPTPSSQRYPRATPSPRLAVTKAHADAIWSVAAHEVSELVVSGSADGKCKLWDSSTPALRERWSTDLGSPVTAVQFLKSDFDKVLAGTQDGSMYLIDTQTGAVFVKFKDDESADGDGTGFLYDARSHPTMGVVAGAYGAKMVKIFDIGAGSCVDTMVAHPSAVSSVDFDPSGLYMISAGHNRSVRIWDFSSKKCVYENTAHRHKFDESIHAARFHPSAAYYASAGADAIVRVYA